MSLQNEWTQRIAELEAKLTDVELRCVKICGQRDELLAAAKDYYNATIAEPRVRITSTVEALSNKVSATAETLEHAIAKARGQV